MRPGRFEITQKVLVLRGDRLLVLHDRQSAVGDLPGGRMGPDELLRPWADAVRRELAEELGPVEIALDDAPALAFPHLLPASGLPALGLLWVGRWVAGEVVLSDEHDDLAWAPLEGPWPWLDRTLADAVRRWLATRAGGDRARRRPGP